MTQIVARPSKSLPGNWGDLLLALGVGGCALAVYVRTLAPGVLYSDSAEFQSMAYSLGVTHPSGYPIYILLAKLFTFLPIQNIAWRVNFVSALCAALTLVGVALLVRQQTRSYIGAVLGSLILGIGYTFWSQAIIAEVYTPTTFLIVLTMLLVWRWHGDPARRGQVLFLACLLVGLGVHITLLIMIPAIVIFVFWNLAALRVSAPTWLRSILWASAGAVTGALIFFLAFILLDSINPPNSYLNVTLLPSRSAFGLTLADLDSPFERFLATAFSRQWQKSMFSGNLLFMIGQLKNYVKWALRYDLSVWVVLLALLGILAVLRRRPRWGSFLLIYGAVLLFLILNYEGPGKFVFYPATYLLIAIAAGVGTGTLLEWLRQSTRNRSKTAASLLILAACLLILWVLVAPYWNTRWQALQAGAATFFDDENTYPIYNLQEPQQLAEQRLSQVEEEAVLLLEWRTLYASAYVAAVEYDNTAIRFLENCINRDDQRLANSLIEEIKQELLNGRPVYSDRVYPYLEETFNFAASEGTDLFRMTLK